MRFLVVGCGSIGRKHIANLRAISQEVSVYDNNVAMAGLAEKKYGVKAIPGLDKVKQGEYDGVFICAPTKLHVPIAVEMAEKGMNLFIEKPLSDDLKGVDRLSEIVKKKKLTVLVGCNTRFFPSFMLAEKLIKKNKIGRILSVRVECGFYLPYWHPSSDYRKEYSANKSLGGGVILDDIHEIDSLCHLFGKVKEVFCCADKVSNLSIDTEDCAEIFMRFQSGIMAQIHLDYLQRTYYRIYKFIGEKGTVVWNYIDQTVEYYSEKADQWKVFRENINCARDIMFRKQSEHFIRCIECGERSANDILSAAETLKVALACKESSRKRKMIFLG